MVMTYTLLQLLVQFNGKEIKEKHQNEKGHKKQGDNSPFPSGKSTAPKIHDLDHDYVEDYEEDDEDEEIKIGGKSWHKNQH